MSPTDPNATRRPRRASQSAAYLAQAAEALTDASNPRALWIDAPEYYGGSRLEPAQRALTAHNRRLTFLRSSVLFSALAAEAYANEFLAAVLTSADVVSVDRMATPDKLLLGPRLAGLQPPLDRGEEPLQTITRLFRVRNALVHPRRDGVSAFVQDVDEQDKAQIGPRVSGEYLLAVARAIVLLNPLRPRPGIIGGATYLARHPEVVTEHLELVGEEITGGPPGRRCGSCQPHRASTPTCDAAWARPRAALTSWAHGARVSCVPVDAGRPILHRNRAAKSAPPDSPVTTA